MTIADNDLSASTPRSAQFAIPDGGVDAVLAALAHDDPSLPAFVYERLDPSTRRPVTTWIGLRTAEVVTAEPGTDPFQVLRDQLPTSPIPASRGVVFSFIAYPQGSTFTPRKNVGSLGTPQGLFLSFGAYLRIDHTAGYGEVIDQPSADPESDVKQRRTVTDWAGLVEAARPPADDQPDLQSQETVFDWQPATNEVEFADGVNRFQKGAAGSTEIGGVVLSVQMTSATRSDPLASYRALRHLNPSTVMFLLRHDGFALWGATSLSMVEIAGGHLIAETDGATHPVPVMPPGETYTWNPSEKEVYEYDVVANALHDDLETVAKPGTLTFTREKEHRTFFGLSHLFAEMRAELADDVDSVGAVQALFPHGAAVGHPRTAALKLIDDLELVPRGPFSGAVGVFGYDGSADVASVTRSMWTTTTGSYAQAGAKVVPASSAREEYEESVLKTKAVRATARKVAE